MPKRTVAVVDGNSLVHRAFHALPPTMTAPDGRPTNAVFGFVSMLVKMVGDLKPDGVVVAFDRGKPAFRTEVMERYKVHRKPMADELRVQFPMVREVLDALGVPVLEVEGWEGDDILGTLAERAKAEDVNALLVTGDRDALQLVDDDVSVVSTRKGITDIVVYDREGVIERCGVPPERIPDYLGLKGDTSDNIPGVPGVGEKTAARLVSEHGSLEAVLEAASGIKGKLGENLREHAEEALASREVATIRRDLPLEVDLNAVRWGDWDPRAVLETFNRFAFTTLVDRVFASAEAAAGAPPSPAPAAAEPSVGPPPVSVLGGPEALRRLRERLAAEPGSWVGAALDDGAGETLFPGERTLAAAYAEETLVCAGGDARAAAVALVRSGRAASGDVKGLLRVACAPGDDDHDCVAAAEVDAPRLFDCGVAAYLLQSNRPSYDLPRLTEEHLGRRLPEPGDPGGRAAARARSAAELRPVLREKLERDGSAEVFDRIEMPLAPVLVRMEDVGVGIDCEVLDALTSELAGRIGALRDEIVSLAGVEFNPDSPKQLAEVLFEKLQLPVGKRTKTGYSTDSSVLQALAPSYPVCARVLEYRELTKLKSTYIDALPRLLGGDGRLHTTFNQTVAATGRLSSSNPNLQNIPIRTELGRRIRAAFVPAVPGDLMVTADYSQIELRILAHLSEDQGLIEAFTSGADFHAATAARVFGVAPEDVDAEGRRRAKAVNFGIVYGISAHGLSESLGVGRAEAQEMIDRYFAAYPRVREYLDRVVAEAHRDGYATTVFGRKRHIPELASSNWNLRSFGERTAMNHPMQGTAADVMKLAMIEVDRRLREEGFASRMVLQVHDELVFESPAGEVERLGALARDTMSGVASLAVPLVVDVSSGPDWASAK
ncbi:MAG: DNA polymerase I [Coriobacteriia bacterium]|nr:DNA polymerase I [Coriobacteriia bacterium]